MKRSDILLLVKEIFIVLLALLSVGLLIFELSSDLLPEQIKLIQNIDLLICIVFLTDFFVGLRIAKSKKGYFRSHWLDLLASVPISGGVFNSLRVLRLVRLVRVLRVIARIRRIGNLADTLVDSSSQYIYAVTVTTAVILSGAVAFFSMEEGVNQNVDSFFDAIWWAVTTTTTVGYGDVYPVTVEGRIIGMFMMFFGIGLVGTIAGLSGGYFLKRRQTRAVE